MLTEGFSNKASMNEDVAKLNVAFLIPLPPLFCMLATGAEENILWNNYLSLKYLCLSV